MDSLLEPLDFRSPESRGNKFLLFEGTRFVAICFGSPRKLIHTEIKNLSFCNYGLKYLHWHLEPVKCIYCKSI